MNHMRILVPISHTEGADTAFERALALARTSNAELYLVHAVPVDHSFSWHAMERRARLAELRTRAAAAGVPVQTAEQHGDAADVIVLHADARAVDLIVIATEGRTGWERFRQPSVAERVVRRTTRPTLVVREDGPVPADFRNVLVAVDLSPTSKTLMEMAKDLFGRDARQLTVLHAVNSLEAADAVWSHARWIVPEYREYVLSGARRRVEAMTPRIDAGTSVQVHVAPGPTADAIVQRATAVDADLIVVGRSKRFMRSGATAVRLLRDTDRALLIVPPTAAGRASTPRSQASDERPRLPLQAPWVSRALTRRKEEKMSTHPLVVVAIDGSTDTESIVELAAAIARRRAANLHAVQVVSRRGGLWIAPDDETSLRARLRALRPSIERHGINLRTITLRGTPESAIPAYAQLHGASVIVLGRHFGTSRLWRSSAVAHRVSRASPVPVLVVPPEPATPLSVTRIVAAVDFRIASAIALRTAADIAKQHGAALTMLHAMTWPRHMVFSGAEASRLARRLPAETKRIAERLTQKARALGADDADALVVTGAPDRRILEAAEKSGADLIVMGVAPRTWLDQVTFGSTLRAILRRAETPVLVVPVVAGAHEWLDVSERDTSSATSTDAPVTRVAA
jgi:nucleotide-binding universal stress UspA family protein